MKARHLVAVLAAIVILVVAGCAPSIKATNLSAAPTPAPTERPEMVALHAAEEFLESYLGRKLDQLDVAYGTAEWPNVALGCPEPGIDYAPIATSGYQFEITVDGVRFEIHTSWDGSRVVLCPSRDTGDVPGNPQLVAMDAARALLAGILGTDPEQIGHAVTTEPGQWPGSAMGCPAEGQVYEQTEISGYRFQFVYGNGLFDVRASGDGQYTILCGDDGAVTHQQQGRVSGTREGVPEAVQRPLAAAVGVLADLADLPPDTLALDSIEWQQITFSSSALGCPEPGMAYLDVLTEGFGFWLGYVDEIFEIHTDLEGSVAVLCEEPTEPAGGELVPGLAPQGAAFTSFGNEQIGFGISYPLGWWVEADPVSGEAFFRPGNNLPTFGMQITRLGDLSGDVDTWLAAYQAELGSSDPTASQDAVVQTVGMSGRSQRFNRDLRGTRVMERVTFFPEGYRVRQWAPADQWAEWDERFVQMLGSLVFHSPD
jgi:hypothetical protein